MVVRRSINLDSLPTSGADALAVRGTQRGKGKGEYDGVAQRPMQVDGVDDDLGGFLVVVLRLLDQGASCIRGWISEHLLYRHHLRPLHRVQAPRALRLDVDVRGTAHPDSFDDGFHGNIHLDGRSFWHASHRDVQLARSGKLETQIKKGTRLSV